MPTTAPKRGAFPSPRNALAAASPHVADTVGLPATYLVQPGRISMWGNDVHGDCVSAEEAFAKACHSPEIFVSDHDVTSWAQRHGVLEGAFLSDVLGWMQHYGFLHGSSLYLDGPALSVDWTSRSTLRSAITHGPVKLGVAGDQIEVAWDSTDGATGWIGTGFHHDDNEDHCVALCGYGTIGWLAQQLRTRVPHGVDPATAAYAVFTWNSIGILDEHSMIAITQEAWLRRPTTVALTTAAGDRMQPGQMLLPGGTIHSAGGRYALTYQTDGNLVLYQASRPLWSSKTSHHPAGVCVLQNDGNLVLYPPDNGSPVWSSHTYGHPGSHLIVQDDGDLVIYQPDLHPVWSTGTRLPTGPTATGATMQPGQVLDPGQSLHSANEDYRLSYQIDGNLVLYQGSHAIWASHTNGRPAGVCIMQTDGNLVVYRPGPHAVWSSGSYGHPGAHLIVQDDRDVVIFLPNGQQAWATHTTV